LAELSRDFEKKILDEVLCPELTDTLGVVGVVDEGVDGEEGVEDEEIDDSLLGSGTGLFPLLLVLAISLLALTSGLWREGCGKRKAEEDERSSPLTVSWMPEPELEAELVEDAATLGFGNGSH